MLHVAANVAFVARLMQLAIVFCGLCLVSCLLMVFIHMFY